VAPKQLPPQSIQESSDLPKWIPLQQPAQLRHNTVISKALYHLHHRHQLPNGVQLSFSRCPHCSDHVMTKVTTKTDKADLSCSISWEACQASLQTLDRSTDALVTELDSSRMSSGACHTHEARVRRVNFQFQSPHAIKKLLTSFDCVFAISISNNLAVSETWLRILSCSRSFLTTHSLLFLSRQKHISLMTSYPSNPV